MLKKLFALTVLFASVALSQLHEPFTGGAAILDTVTGTDWKKWAGQTHADASLQRFGDGTGGAYHPTGVGYGGGLYYDTLHANPFEIAAVIGQLAGSAGTRDFFLTADDNTTFATGGGICLGYQQNTGTDLITLRLYNQWTGDHTPSASWVPSGFSTVSISRDLVVGDTVFLRLWSNAATIGVHSGATTDTASALYTALTGGDYTNTINAATGASRTAGLYVVQRTTPVKINDFYIRVPGSSATPPPPATDVDPPVAGSLSPNRYSPSLGQGVYVTFPATDDSALGTFTVEVDTGVGGYHTIGTYTASGAVLSYTFTSPTFTRYVAGNATIRGRISDKRSRLDTTATVTVTFSDSPDSSLYKRKLFAWLPFNEVAIPAAYNNGTALSGRVPIDSLPWGVLTHVSMFAADVNAGATALTGGSAAEYLRRMIPTANYAHSKDVYCGFSFGGSGDANVRNAINTPALHAPLITLCLDLIDNYQLDFIDFDIETTPFDAAQWAVFAARLNDSLLTRQSWMDPSVPPFIAWTVFGSRAVATVTSAGDVEQLNLMSYDKTGDWWCETRHDCAVTSWTYLNATGPSTDYVGTCGQNKVFPSLQEEARQAIAAGWPAAKVIINADFNPTYITGGTFADGRGPTTIRKTYTVAPTFSGSGLKFYSQWSSVLSLVPSDSIKWDPISHVYYAHTGTDLASDRLILQTAWPGRDSTVYYIRQVVDSMEIGGAGAWGLTETYGTGTAPAGGWAWLSHQFTQHFVAAKTIDTTCQPPSLTSPANGATDVVFAPTGLAFSWGSVACAAASGGYNFQFDNNADFTSPEKDTIITGTSLSMAQGYFLNNTAYSWRVRTKDATSLTWGAWSNPNRFTTIAAAPGAPVIYFPPNNLVLAGTNTPVFWNPSTNGPTTWTHGTSFYHIQASTSITFSPIFKQDSGNTVTLTRSYNLTGMNNSTDYYIRVRAKTAGGYSPYSSAVKVTTGAALPAIPVLSYPPDGTGGLPVNDTLRWQAANNALSYDVQVDTEATFSNPIIDDNTTNTYIQALSLDSGQTYLWRVRSVGQTANSSYSDIFSFTIIDPAEPPFPNAIMQMVYWWDQLAGTAPLNRAASWVYWGTSLPDMSNVPAPQAGIIAWSVYGVKYRTDWGTDTTLLYSFAGGSGSTLTMEALSDSFETASALTSLNLREPIVIGPLSMLDADTSGGYRFYSWFNRPNSRQNVAVDWPSISGRMIVQGDDWQGNSATLTHALGAPSGGFGTTPEELFNSGYTLGLWGFVVDAPGAPASWKFFTPPELSDLGLLSAYGITGPKIPYLDVNEQWQFADTNMWRDAGTGSYPSGPRIIDSLNTGQQNDTLTNSLTMTDTLFLKYVSGNTFGYIFGGNGYILQHTLGTSTYYEVRNSQNNSGFSSRDKVPFAVNQGSATGGVVSREYTSMTGTDPERVVMQGKATTTDDATVVVIKSILLDDSSSTGTGVTFPDSATYTVTAHINGTWITGAGGTEVDGAAYILTGTYRQAGTPGSTLALIGSVTTVHSAESAAFTSCTPAFVINGKWLEVSVDGDASSEIVWTATIDITWSGGY